MPREYQQRQDKEKQGFPFLPIRFLRFGVRARAVGIIAALFADPLAGAALLVPLILFLLALPFMLGAAPGAPGAPTTPVVGAPGLTCDISGVNLFRTNAVTDDKLQEFIENNKTVAAHLPVSEFSRRTRYIRDTASSAGFNPAFFLALWKTESGFSNYSKSKPGNDLGCILSPPDRPPPSDPNTAFEWGVRCVTGTNSRTDDTCKSTANNIAAAVCAKNQDPNSEACRCVRDIHEKHKGKTCYQPFNIPIKTVNDYLQAFGSVCFDANNINTINGVPQIIGQMGLAKCTQPISTGNSSCPLSGSIRISTGTKDYPEGTPPSGHCGKGYPIGFDWCKAENLAKTRTSKATHAIDVSAKGKIDVSTILPIINGEKLTWALVQVLPVGDIGGGLDFTGKSSSGKEYFLHLYHLDGQGSNITGFINKSSFTSGEVVATRLFPLRPEDGGPHLHFTIATRDDKNNWVMLEPNGQLHMCDGKAISPPVAVPGGKSVVLDPGHGNPDLDTAQLKSAEGALNLVVANRLKTSLEAVGFTVILTHNSNIPIADHYSSLSERVKKINGSNASILVSIHFDNGVYSFSGPKAYYNTSRSFSNQNRKLAESVCSALEKTTGFKITGGCTASDFYSIFVKGKDVCDGSGPNYILGPKEIKTCPNNPASEIQEESKMPGILQEMLIQRPYLEMAADETLINKIVDGYTQGIIEYFQPLLD